MENCIAKSGLAVSTGTAIAAKGETRGTLTVETARGIGAVPTHAGVALTLVDVHTFPSLCLITRITQTLEATLSVDALAMVTHACLPTLVDVPAKRSVWCKFKAHLAGADVGAQCVGTAAPETPQWVFTTLICVHT